MLAKGNLCFRVVNIIFLNIDSHELTDFAANFDSAVKKAIQQGMAGLAAATNSHIIEQANQKLHSTRDLFIENLERYQEEDGTWIIVLDAKAAWINDGLQPFDLRPGFLKSPKAKTNSKGGKYLTIPFEHNKAKTGPKKELLSAIKNELSSIGVNLNKIETDAKGDPKLGLVRSLDITTKPIKKTEGAGSGSGSVGQVMQGHTGIPLLKGVRIYQRKIKDKHGADKIQKSVVTFRTVSENSPNINAFKHPGTNATNIMEDGAKWALSEFDHKVLPAIIEAIRKST